MSEQASSTGTDSPTPRSGRSTTVLTTLLLGLAAVALWGSSRMAWVQVTSSDGKTLARTTDLDGGTWAAAMTPLALTLLAAVAASFAVRGWAVRVVGLLVGLVGVAVAIPAVQLLVSGADADRAADLAELSSHLEEVSAESSVLPPLLALVGAVAALAAGVLLMRKPKARAGLSSKYDNPAARREAAAKLGQGNKESTDEPVTQRMLWDALDAGEDPTLDTDGEKRDADGNEPGKDSRS